MPEPPEGYAAVAGLNLEYPIFNRGARAEYKRSKLDKKQLQNALKNLEQLVELELRQAYIELNRSQRADRSQQAPPGSCRLKSSGWRSSASRWADPPT